MVAHAADECNFVLLESAFSVACNELEVREYLGRALSELIRNATAAPARHYVVREEDGRYALIGDGQRVASVSTSSDVLEALFADVNRRAIDDYSGFAVHAGVVANDGAAIAFPAESGTGKSTLTAACLGAGFAYVSDEALCVDPRDCRVVPYPKPIALAPSTWSLVGYPIPAATDPGTKITRSASALGASVVDAASRLRLAHVVELARLGGTPRLVARPRADTIALLLAMSFNHYKMPRVAFEVASQLAAQSRAWRLEYGDPRDAAALLRAELAS